MNHNLSIENTTWQVKELQRIVSLGRIIKPKFQRKSRWLITPDKNHKKPSYSEYIKFLYKTENSVDPISFGIIIKSNEVFYVNIDGNNRLNAIMTFIKTPLVIFRDKLKTELKELEKYIPKNIINSIDYSILSSFRRLDDITQIKDYIKDQNLAEYKEIQDIMIDIQTKLSLNKDDKFTDTVKINVNIFKNGSYDDYNDIFSSINRHSNELSENDLLASLLFSRKITIDDNNQTYKILNNIKEYYKKRDDGEILSNSVNTSLDEINIFDYMLGLQNLMKENCPYLKKYVSKGLGYIFRLFKIIYKIDKIRLQSFENFEHINFTKKCIDASKLLANIFNSISNSCVNDKIFGKKGSISSIFGENSKILLLISIISMKNNNINDIDIVSSISIACFYHIVQKTLSKMLDNFNDDENKIYLDFLGNDKLQYQAGGSFIDNVCRKIISNSPRLITKNITSVKLRTGLTLAVKYLNKPPDKIQKNPKRKKLTLFHKVLFNIVIRLSTPIELLNKAYSIEHLVPYSTICSSFIDRDRIGNLYPIPLEYNKKRGNRNITKYSEICNDYYNSTIKNIISKKEYNIVVKYVNTKPIIENKIEFDNLCNKIENLYIDKCIAHLFNN